ncbi:hypothetical protein BH11MYX1_BH11MYX1_26950 [soil metagenome]
MIVLAACTGHPGKNEVLASHVRAGKAPDFKAHVTQATFDGTLVVLELGPRIHVVIARCYAHAHQQLGDHDHVTIELDHTAASAGELDIADCSTKHVVASLWATFEDGTKLEASIDADLAHAP